MTCLVRGSIVGALHLALVLGIAGKYEWDRQNAPRTWVRVAPIDPDSLLRGRYLLLRPTTGNHQVFEYFLPEHAPDPTRLGPNEELWAEVSLVDGRMRPIRLERRSVPVPVQ